MNRRKGRQELLLFDKNDMGVFKPDRFKPELILNRSYKYSWTQLYREAVYLLLHNIVGRKIIAFIQSQLSH
jgi:hypothetical protein